jgi:hypothetical protein
MTTEALLDELIRATQSQTDLLRQIAGGISSNGGGGGGPDKDGIFKRGLIALGGASVDTAKSVGTLGKAAFDSVLSMSSVANALTGLPGPLGTLASVAGMAATAIEGIAKNYNTLTASGINFGGSLTNMKLAASGAYMSLDQFASMLSTNSATLAKMGGNVDDGAQAFARVSNTLNKSPAGDALRSLGYTSEQLNSGLINYIGITGGRNKEELKTVEGQKKLAESAAAYMTQLDGLAQITGQSREEQEKALKAEMEEASFQAFLATKSKDEQEAIAASMASAGALYGKAGQDIVRSTAMGIAVQGEAGQKLTALSGGTAAAIQNDLAIRKQGGDNLSALNANEAKGRAETAKNLLPLAGAVGTAGGALKGMDVAVKNMAAAQQAGIKGEQGFQEQRASIAAKQKEQAASQAASVAKAQTSLNELGQQIMAKLMPVFGVIINVATQLATGLNNILGPIIEFGSRAIGGLIQPFLKFWDSISSAFMSADWAGIGAKVSDVIKKMWTSTVEFLQPLLEKGSEIFTKIAGDLGPVFSDFADIMSSLFDIINAYVLPVVQPIISGIMDAILPLWDAFKAIIKSIKFILSGDFSSAGTMLSSAFGSLIDSLKALFKGLLDGAKKLLNPANWFGSSSETPKASANAPKPPEGSAASSKPPENPTPAQAAAVAKAAAATPEPTSTASAPKPESMFAELQTLNKQTADILRVMREVAEHAKRNVDATRSLNKNLFA